MRGVGLFMLMCILHFSSCGQADNIRWSNDRKLRWSDFTQVSDTANIGDNKYFSAVTRTYYSHSISEENNSKKSIGINLYTSFHKGLSAMRKNVYAKPDSVQTRLLNHEQKHFDLAELYRRNMVQKIQETHFSSSYAEEIQKIIEQKQKAFNLQQLFYDYETMHGVNKAAQKGWDRYIETTLDSLKAFSNNKIIKEFF